MSIETQVKTEELYFEEDMPESQAQINLNDYGKDVLMHQYTLQDCFITGNLAIIPPPGVYGFSNIAPDIAVFKGVSLTPAEQLNLTSWKISEPNRPAPTVVFEISSKDTWNKDLDPKPEFYRQLGGVSEYFAYDPQRLWQNATTQLRGWRYQNGLMLELQPDSQGRLWSEELESWLTPDGAYLRFYDRDGKLRLTAREAALEEKAEADLRRAEAQQLAQTAKRRAQVAQQHAQAAQLQTEGERTAKEAALLQVEAERTAKEAALLQAEAERTAKEAEQAARKVAELQAKAERAAKEAALLQAETERAELQALLEKLRKRNIDPDTL